MVPTVRPVVVVVVVAVSDNDTLKDVLNHSDIIRIMQEHKPGSQVQF